MNITITDADSIRTVIESGLIGFVVTLDIPENTGYPTEGLVERVDDDGDVVVRELGERGKPISNSTFAIPQYLIQTIDVL